MLQSISKVLSGTVLGQVISLLALPVVMRFYSPSDYGLFGTALVFVGLMAIMATMQLHQGIVMPRFYLHGVRLFQIGCVGSLLAGAFAFFSAAVYFFLFVDTQDLLITPAILAVAVTVTGVGQCMQGMAVRIKAFGAIGYAAILRSILVASVQLIFGIYAFGYKGLLIGYLLGEVGSAMVLWLLALRSQGLGGSTRLTIRHWIVLKKYRDIASFGTFQELLNSASQGLPVIIINNCYGASVAGLYAFSMRILLAPSQLVANAVRQVASEHFSKIFNLRKSLSHEFKRTTIILAIPTILLSLILIPFLPDLYEIIFGAKWRESGVYGQWLIIWAAFGVFNTPSVIVMRLLRKQRQAFYLNGLIFLTRAVSLLICGFLFSEIITVAFFAVLGVFWNTALIVFAQYYIRLEAAE